MISTTKTPGPDVVIIGGGPIGLWTAIQTKVLSKTDVLVVEKYSEYRRADIRLNINASSFNGIPKCEPLQVLVKKWGNKVVPIKEIEDELAKCAHNLGVKILRDTTVDPKTLQEQFPTARVFVGADGARSTVRKELFGDYKFNTPLQYIAQVQYLIKTPSDMVIDSSVQKIKESAQNYKKQKFSGHIITESIRREGDGLSRVTLHVFLNEKTYWEMTDATFGNPYYFEKDLDKVPDVLRDTLIKWWGSNKELEIVTDVEKKNKISVIPLASYASKDVFKVVEKNNDPDDQVITALVGDASQAFPFFRAINNGFILGTHLAQCIADAFANLNKANEQHGNSNRTEKKERARIFASSFNSYSRYSTLRAYIERTRAFMKNLFIILSDFWLKLSAETPWQSVKFSEQEKEKNYQRGANIWEQLSGKTPPTKPTAKGLKQVTKELLRSNSRLGDRLSA